MKVRAWEWWIVGALGITAFLLGMYGFHELFKLSGTDRNISDLAFFSMKMFALEFMDGYVSPLPISLELARWLGPLVLLYTAGKAVIYFVRREFGSIFLKYKKEHVIITSLNEKARFLASDLLTHGRKVVVVARLENNNVQDVLESQGAVIVDGDFADLVFLKSIAAHRASHFIFVEDDDANLSNAMLVLTYIEGCPGTSEILLHTHISNERYQQELNDLKFFEEANTSGASSSCWIQPFSISERVSRTFFRKHSPDIYKPVVSEHDPQVHIAITGANTFSRDVIVQVARLGHFVNMKKIKISWIHEDNGLFESLLEAYPQLDKLIELRSYPQPDSNFNVGQIEEFHAEHSLSALYILNDADSVSIGILNEVSQIQTNDMLNVVLSLADPVGVINKWYSARELGNINLEKFNFIEESFTDRSIISEEIDILAKEIHKVHCARKNGSTKMVSQKLWEDLPIHYRNQARHQADHLEVKIRALGCDVVDQNSAQVHFEIEKQSEKFELLSATEHNRWMASQYLDGWVLGERDDAKKMHPDLVPYSELSDDKKSYDRDSVSNMSFLLKLVGKRIAKKD